MVFGSSGAEIFVPDDGENGGASHYEQKVKRTIRPGRRRLTRMVTFDAGCFSGAVPDSWLTFNDNS